MQTAEAVGIRGGTVLADKGRTQAQSTARAYVLLRAVPGARRRLVDTLLAQPGVVTVDEVEGPLDIVLVIEASDRSHLARTLVRALGSVETMFEGLEMLPAQRRRAAHPKVSKNDTGRPA